jgi:hypothetical protein
MERNAIHLHLRVLLFACIVFIKIRKVSLIYKLMRMKTTRNDDS